uniref:Putative secreted protein n=1 Tax=Anopheles darlingi TaxID=43151 RepID=A0A2M4DCD3_ANODA
MPSRSAAIVVFTPPTPFIAVCILFSSTVRFCSTEGISQFKMSPPFTLPSALASFLSLAETFDSIYRESFP